MVNQYDIHFIHSAAAAAAKSLQSCPTLCDPIDSSPPGSPIPGILQARTLEWVAISFSNAWKWKAKVKLLSRVQLFATPWTEAYQAPPPMGFSSQEYWSGVPLPSPFIHSAVSNYLWPHGPWCREPAWGALPVAKVMRKEAWHTQRWDQASGVPLEILEHLPPKPESAYFTALCSHLHLWLYGGLSPTTSLWKRVNLQLQLIKFLGVIRVF